MFEIKWGKRVLLTIIWNHRKWHVHRNPVKRKAPEEDDPYGFGAKVGNGIYPMAGE